MTPRRSVFLRPVATKSVNRPKNAKLARFEQNWSIFSKIGKKKSLTAWYNKANGIKTLSNTPTTTA